MRVADRSFVFINVEDDTTFHVLVLDEAISNETVEQLAELLVSIS